MQLPVGKNFLTIREKGLNHTFGMVRTNPDGSPKGHQGWDIAAFSGSPVCAVAGGEVQFVQEGGAYGKQICHSFEFKGKTLFAFYAHLQAANVKAGQKINEGQIIGLVGQTGTDAEKQHWSKAHLHFEIRTTNNNHLGRGFGGRLDPGTVLGWDPILDLIFQDFPKLG